MLGVFYTDYLINISLHVSKEPFFTRNIASPPDKGDLGGFFHQKVPDKGDLGGFKK